MLRDRKGCIDTLVELPKEKLHIAFFDSASELVIPQRGVFAGSVKDLQVLFE